MLGKRDNRRPNLFELNATNDEGSHLPPGTPLRSSFFFWQFHCAATVAVPQLARILESFPREGQIRAEVVVTFYHKVSAEFYNYDKLNHWYGRASVMARLRTRCNALRN